MNKTNMLCFFLGRKWKIFKYLGLIGLLYIAFQLIIILILSRQMEIKINNMSMTRINKINEAKFPVSVKNSSVFDFTLKEFNIKSKNAEFMDSSLNNSTWEKFEGINLPSGKSISTIIYKPVKIFKLPVGQCDAVLILKKYVFTFKLPTKFNIE